MAVRLVLLLALVLAASPDVTPSVATPSAVRAGAASVRRALAAPGPLRVDARALGRDALVRVYAARDFAPIWTADAVGLARVAALVRALGGAPSHGLDPEDYQLAAVQRRAWPGEGAAGLERELLLTDAALRYAGDLRGGRVLPGDVDRDWAIPPRTADAAAELLRAIEDDALPAWPARLAPARPEYAQLVDALARYRELAAAGWGEVPAGERLRPGAQDERVRPLRARLVATGDLARGGSDGDRYDATLETAVRRFQARHGLEPDGIVGPATQRALDVPARARAEQIALNLERWRWLPEDFGRRHVTVNAAAATLEVREAGRVRLMSRAVVGDPLHPTPVLSSRVEAVVFHPVWYVPVDIARLEILPRLIREPRFLADNDIVIAGREATDPHGLAVDWHARPPGDRMALRQRAGPANPLGPVKLDTPNRFQVYLHDSPARALFVRPVRTLSHGCVRVEAARALAALALEGAPGWGPERIARVIEAGDTLRVTVTQPLPVYLLYWTAFVDAAGAVHFRDDVYGRDARLAAALARRVRSAPRAPKT